MHYLIRVHFSVSLKRKASASFCALNLCTMECEEGGEKTTLHAKLIQPLMLQTGPKIYHRELPEKTPFLGDSTFLYTCEDYCQILNLWLFLRAIWHGSQRCLVVLHCTDLQYFMQQGLLTSAYNFVLSLLNRPTCDLANQHPRWPTGASI